MANRRNFLQSALGFGAGLFASEKLLAQASSAKQLKASRRANPGPAFYVPVTTPDGGTKVFHLTADVS